MRDMFDATAPALSCPIQQSPEFAAALHALGQTPILLADRSLVLHRRWMGLSLALLSRSRPDITHLSELVIDAGLGRTPLVLNPDVPCPDLAGLGALPLMTPATVAELDLTGDLRAGLRQKWRNRLRHAETQKLRVTRQNLADNPRHWLLRADRLQQHERRYRNWPDALVLAYARANPGRAKLFTAYHRQLPVAALLILRHADAATYQIGHVTPHGRHLSAQNLLMWRAMTWLADLGCQRLDLGLISTEHQQGIARFKLGTGARARRLGGTWLWHPPLGRVLRPLAALDLHMM